MCNHNFLVILFVATAMGGYMDFVNSLGNSANGVTQKLNSVSGQVTGYAGQAQQALNQGTSKLNSVSGQVTGYAGQAQQALNQGTSKLSSVSGQVSGYTDQAQNKLNSVTGKVGELAGQGAAMLDTVPGKLSEFAEQGKLSAQQIASTLQGLRTTTFAKLDEVNLLLNKTSSTEKAVVEKGFATIEKVIEQINAYTNLEITNEYEAAEVSAFIQSKVAQATQLLTDLRSYMNKYVDKAADIIATALPIAEKTTQAITQAVTDTSSALKNIATIMDAKRLENELKLNAGVKKDVLTMTPTERLLDQMSYSDIMSTAKSLGDTSAALVGQLGGIATSLPESSAKNKIASILSSVEKGINTFDTTMANVQNTVQNFSQIADNSINTAKNVFNQGKNVIDQGKNILGSLGSLF